MRQVERESDRKVGQMDAAPPNGEFLSVNNYQYLQQRIGLSKAPLESVYKIAWTIIGSVRHAKLRPHPERPALTLPDIFAAAIVQALAPLCPRRYKEERCGFLYELPHVEFCLSRVAYRALLHTIVRTAGYDYKELTHC